MTTFEHKNDVSIVVTVYNQPLPSVLRSLASAAMQKGVGCQIVIADDCSRRNETSRYADFLNYLGYKNYAVARCEHNLQTVGNLVNAAQACTGRFVKSLGAGDLLFERNTISQLLAFCLDNSLRAAFGDCVAFTSKDLSGGHRYLAPTNKQDYQVNAGGRVLPKTLLAHQLLCADWIPGGAQFFEKNVYERLLRTLYSDYSIRYCEDFAATLFLFENCPCYAEAPAVWYEMDSGISTTVSVSSMKRLYRDHAHFYRSVAKSNPYHSRYLEARLLFMIRKLVATTPLYGMLRRQKNGQYASGDAIPFNDFYLDCCERVETYLER